MTTQKITPFLWFNTNAEEAIDFYLSVFKNGKIKNKSYYSDAGPGPKGTLMTAVFELNGQEFIALNGGPQFKFTEAISFVINCSTQQEIDNYWEALSQDGEKSRCGWLKDKFGLWWQVVPDQLATLMTNGNAKQAARVMQAMMGMTKLEIEPLQKAFAES